MKTEPNKFIATQEQITEWKKLHGGGSILTVEDGRICYIFSPLSSILVMKQAFTAIQESEVDFVSSILKNCWLGGDESIKEDEGCLNDLVDQTKKLIEWPEAAIEFENELPVLVCNGERLKVRKPSRTDIQTAERKNAKKAPFETNIQLLQLISVDDLEFERIRKYQTKEFFGMLSEVEGLKKKTTTLISKF